MSIKSALKICLRKLNLIALSQLSKKINRVAFFVHTSELLNHFAPIWDSMNYLEFDVIFKNKKDMLEFKSDSNWNCRTVYLGDVLNGRWRYECLVSNHAAHSAPRNILNVGLHLFEIIAVENLRLQYAAGKIGWNLSEWNRVYDGIMCFGPHHKKLFKDKFKAKIVEVGYPRFDSYFSKQINAPGLLEMYRCNPSRKTVVWLPTWTELSSIDHFDHEVSELTGQFNVIVKVHPMMNEEKPERVAKLKRLMGPDRVIDDTRDNVHLYQIADYMLFDYGGPVFGAVYTNRKFILLNVPGSERHPHTGNSSPDVMLRKVFLNVDPGQNRIKKILVSGRCWETHFKLCGEIRHEYFATNYGNSGATAASAITNRGWINKSMSEN